MRALTEAGRVRLEQGRAAFNRAQFFEAHEIWEEVWKTLDGLERILAQGLIQIAAGLHHLHQGRTRPAAGLLRKGLHKISQRAFAPPVDVDMHVDIDLDVGLLARDVARLLAELQVPGAKLPSQLPTLSCRGAKPIPVR